MEEGGRARGAANGASVNAPCHTIRRAAFAERPGAKEMMPCIGSRPVLLHGRCGAEKAPTALPERR